MDFNHVRPATLSQEAREQINEALRVGRLCRAAKAIFKETLRVNDDGEAASAFFEKHEKWLGDE
jgi:hypothetical protein